MFIYCLSSIRSSLTRMAEELPRESDLISVFNSAKVLDVPLPLPTALDEEPGWEARCGIGKSEGREEGKGRWIPSQAGVGREGQALEGATGTMSAAHSSRRAAIRTSSPRGGPGGDSPAWGEAERAFPLELERSARIDGMTGDVPGPTNKTRVGPSPYIPEDFGGGGDRCIPPARPGLTPSPQHPPRRNTRDAPPFAISFPTARGESEPRRPSPQEGQDWSTSQR